MSRVCVTESIAARRTNSFDVTIFSHLFYRSCADARRPILTDGFIHSFFVVVLFTYFHIIFIFEIDSWLFYLFYFRIFIYANTFSEMTYV